MKKLKMWSTLIACTFIFSGCSYFPNNSHSQKPIIVEKDGIELKVDLDKATYSETDDIKIKATLHNKRNEVYRYEINDISCDTSFSFDTNSTVKRLLDISSVKVNEQDIPHNDVCLYVSGYGSLQPNSKEVLEIALSPKKFIEDRKLYKDEKLKMEIGFKGIKLKFDIPIKLEKINSVRNIPENAENSAEHFRNNEDLQKWAKSKGFEMSKASIRETNEYKDYWEISYSVPGDGVQYPVEQAPVDGYIQLQVESDTAKIIKAEYFSQLEPGKSEVIIPRMVLRTQFANELKANPNATYRIIAHSNDFEKYNQKARNQKDINNLKKYNGKVLRPPDSFYTYYADMKGKDILRMAQDKEWEYIMLFDGD
ncbi:hypothetical protein R3O67_34095 [Bacillus cereus]|uniref:hypothetical protein n=1 Tax=Bacillus cereus TaxID=1396 RepID=UPI00307A2130